MPLNHDVDSRLIQAKEFVVDHYNSFVSPSSAVNITIDDVYIVWFSKTLQNWKALMSTTIDDGRYYEATHNGDKAETYLDVYVKETNQVISSR